MQDQIRLRVNGEPRTVTRGDVRALVTALGLDADGGGVAVAIDGRLVPRSRWSEVALEEGASVEIVGATQGG